MDVAPGLLDVVTALLGANLVGVYAYESESSAAHPTGTLLIVTARDLLRDRKYGLAQTLLRHSNEGTPLEALVVREADIRTEEPAVLVQFHFAEASRSTLAGEVGSVEWLKWLDGPTGSVDREELVNRLWHGGCTLAGRPLPEVLATAPTPAEPTPTPATPATRRVSRAPRQLPFE